MKKIIILSMACGVLSLASCKKTYSCSCTTKATGSGTTEEVTTSNSYSEKMKEKQAKSACASSQTAVKAAADKAYNGTGLSVSTSCEVK
jgi:hypothetical protein